MNNKLLPKYVKSHALLIGINKYKYAPPLQFAVNDATEIGKLLIEKFGFLAENVHVLVDEAATQTEVLSKYLAFTNQGTENDDRLIIYFAGHGETIPSRKGDVGFLVPADGKSDDISTLIRWDQLTRNSELINAKHILFIMDACYGGLAISRAMPPASTRFLKDMLLRISRQVLTAGKSNEQVSDSGGPVKDHSIFTGHLLAGLSGEAFDQKGILTANILMAYVYRSVGQDNNSQQTPHFGYLEGDGDMILYSTELEKKESPPERGDDVFYSIPAPLSEITESYPMSQTNQIKEYLSDSKNRIRLNDLIIGQARTLIDSITVDVFPIQTGWSLEELLKRLDNYEKLSNPLATSLSLISYWGNEEFSEIITLPIRRIAATIQSESGLNIWLSLRWYPLLIFLYSCGISSIASSNYKNLEKLFMIPTSNNREYKKTPFVIDVLHGSEEINTAIKNIPGHERQYTPRSEYLFTKLQPSLDDLFFLGPEYEEYFDQFEILLAFEYANQRLNLGMDCWAPIGRFGWKHTGGYASPLTLLVEEATKLKESWPPIIAGLFNSSFTRFQEITSTLIPRITRSGW